MMAESDVDRVVSFLHTTLSIDAEGLRARILESKRPERRRRFIWVARKVDPEQAERVRMAGLPGVALRPEFKRIFPQGVTACHPLGFVGMDDDGLGGMEYLYNRELSGTDGITHVERDGRGGMLSCVERVTADAIPGYTVELTIDSFVQQIAEEVLAAIQEKYEPVSSSAVAINVKTGALLAIANMPNFDPNEFGKVPEEAHRNRAVTDCYEPGSVMKPFAVAAAIEKGLVTPKTRIDCGMGKWKIGRRILKDHHPYGLLDVTEIIWHSSNVGAAKIGVKCGSDLQYRTLRRFGFGSRTGVDLPGEEDGMLAPAETWTSYSTVSIAIGQEMAVTPLQLVTGFAALANEGVVMRPYVVSRVLDSKGRVVRRVTPKALGRGTSAETARQVAPMLAEVVSKGTGRRAKSKLYTTAGKTGTAQKALKGGGGYSHSEFISSFVVFGPVEDPQVCVLVMVNETAPGKAYYGGVVAAPGAGEILERTLRYLMVPTSSSMRVADATSRR